MVDSTKGFLSADRRSSSDVNPLSPECILADHIQNQQSSKIIPKMTLIIPLSDEFGDFHGASESIQNYLQQLGKLFNTKLNHSVNLYLPNF